MCTASWVHEDDGFQLFFNRDEKRTRQRANPPRVETRDGLLSIAPADGDHGGAWISVNERGLALCLLNGAYGGSGLRSRGLLLSGLAGSRTADEAMERLLTADLARYAGFTILALQPGRKVAIAEWNGASATLSDESVAPAPLTSSSVDAAGVRVKRRVEFERITGGARDNAARLFQFHESHGSGADAYSPCMHRADAETVSFSWVRVAPREVTFFYTPAAPCRWIPGQTIAIPRTA
ncbi:MAG: NRDE family protein [Bryobacterales bacterium]|nr:NRDE family protein [Bryobacterales bacterium]